MQEETIVVGGDKSQYWMTVLFADRNDVSLRDGLRRDRLTEAKLGKPV